MCGSLRGARASPKEYVSAPAARPFTGWESRFMITNMRIETTDEERRLLAIYLERDSDTKRLATRNDIKDLVTQIIADLCARADNGEYGEKAPEETPEETPDVLPKGAVPFTPSRGDEPYLYKPKSVPLKEACSRMLDLAEEVEQLVWDVLEKNRERS